MLTDADEAAERERHWGDQWHYPLARIAVTCRAHGLRPIDGPFGDFTDPEGYLSSARRAAVLGYEGKWAIHPSQIELANEVFTPDEHLVEKTRAIIEAMNEAAARGQGRGLAQRPADRRGLDPDGREPARASSSRSSSATPTGNGDQRAAAPARVRDQLGDREAAAIGDAEPAIAVRTDTLSRSLR